jgi:hypothetical protein
MPEIGSILIKYIQYIYGFHLEVRNLFINTKLRYFLAL